MAITASKPAVVLVIEDEPLVLMIAVDMLADAGFETIGASNADQAILILEDRDDIQVIFTDINLPGSMDGLKLAHAVRGRWPPIHLIVTSALRIPAGRTMPEGGRYFQKGLSVSFNCH
jgi:CheY-like chemotaxis protein